MRKIKLSKAEIACDVAGQGRPLLLVAGLGMQLIHWPDGFVHALAERGFRVIRFDLRDSGQSTLHVPPARPRMLATLLGLAARGAQALPYRLWDLARDAVELLDALGETEPAHVVGMSMGGAIAQTLAVHFPERVRSLVSVSSTTGAPLASIGSVEGVRAMLTRPPRTREEAARITAPLIVRVGSRRYVRDLAEARDLAERAFDRSGDPGGHLRLFWAMMAAGDRTKELARVRCPTLVLHGRDDVLVPVRGALATFRAIPGARLHVVPDMGHDLPAPLWGELADAIAAHARAADSALVSSRSLGAS